MKRSESELGAGLKVVGDELVALRSDTRLLLRLLEPPQHASAAAVWTLILLRTRTLAMFLLPPARPKPDDITAHDFVPTWSWEQEGSAQTLTKYKQMATKHMAHFTWERAILTGRYGLPHGRFAGPLDCVTEVFSDLSEAAAVSSTSLSPRFVQLARFLRQDPVQTYYYWQDESGTLVETDADRYVLTITPRGLVDDTAPRGRQLPLPPDPSRGNGSTAAS